VNKFISEVTNEDCMEGMARYPDKYFDLAIVDPPYGIGAGLGSGKNQIKQIKNGIMKGGEWDSNTPTQKYFDELFRVSKNQIVWGGNYMTSFLKESKGWIFWDKIQVSENHSDGELAWTSFEKRLRMFKYCWSGNRYGFESKINGVGKPSIRIHPTEKPVSLYEWLLLNYANQGDKILDTHLGSGSSRIAAYEMGFDFTAFELDTEYFEAQEKRYKAHIAQLKMELV
jgi:site-specific DNA-methyltransferase (adenine-specific)